MTTGNARNSYQLTAVDYDILALVHRYHFLTAEQSVRLRYSKKSLPTAQIRLKALFDANFLERRRLPSLSTGNTSYVYYLATKGQHVLAEFGSDAFSRVRKDDIAAMQYPHLQYVLSLNDFLIACNGYLGYPFEKLVA